VNPKSSKSTGGDIITITGAGFDTSATYRCRFFSDLQTLLYSAPTKPLDTNTLKCVTPNWAAKYNTEIQQIGFEVYHTTEPEGVEINVPRPPGPAFFFSFSAGSAAWTAVTVASSDAAARPQGAGVVGGDTVVFTGTAFSTAKPEPYKCKFVQGETTLTTEPSAITASKLTCATPEFAVEGAVALSLVYGAYTVMPAAAAKATAYGTAAVITAAASTVAVPVKAVYTAAAVTGGILTAAGGQAVAISGTGFDPAVEYQCAWQGSAGAAINTAATVTSATALACTTPVLTTVAKQTFVLVVQHTAAAGSAPVAAEQLALIDARPAAATAKPYGIGAAWYKKSLAAGGAGGGDTITVTGVGLTDKYMCVFGAGTKDTVQQDAVTVSTEQLTCTTPKDYGRTREAGIVGFSIVTKTPQADTVEYTGTAAAAVADQQFEFIAQWSGIAVAEGAAYNPSVSTIAVAGYGFAGTGSYTCGFVTPACFASEAAAATAATNAGTELWARPVNDSCYLMSATAFAITYTGMRCPLPSWQYAAGETRVSVFTARNGKTTQLARSATAADTFKFKGVVVSSSPAMTDISGGNVVELSAVALDPTVLDYLLEWKAVPDVSAGASSKQAAVTAALAAAPGATAYSAVFNGTDVKQCSEVSRRNTPAAAATLAKCISVSAPAWPYTAGPVMLSVVRITDGKSGSTAVPGFVPIGYT
jgi:IPT/TIG domain